MGANGGLGRKMLRTSGGINITAGPLLAPRVICPRGVACRTAILFMVFFYIMLSFFLFLLLRLVLLVLVSLVVRNDLDSSVWCRADNVFSMEVVDPFNPHPNFTSSLTTTPCFSGVSMIDSNKHQAWCYSLLYLTLRNICRKVLKDFFLS
jgi:hypothetical protein